MNVVITSLVAILVIIDNCTRRCLGLPVFIKGRKVTADDVIRALEDRLPPELRYIISDNGKQFIAETFQRLCTNKGVVRRKIERDAGREGMEGCRGIGDGFGRGYLGIQ
jgi:transposase InsO family protein